jgi:major outer membrane protein
MKLRTLWVAALALSLAVTACGERAFAQSRSTSSYRGGYGPATQVAATEEMPSRMPAGSAKSSQSMAAPMASSAGDVGYMSGYSQGCDSQGMPCGSDQGGCCDSGGCQSDCYSTGCGGSCGGCCVGNMLGMGGNSEFFTTADFLSVHASFSQATAFVREDLATGSDQYIPMEFNYNSSYRVGGGWKSCCCGDQIRFMFTQMTSDASNTALPGDIVPEEATAPPGGQTNIRANVDARTLDLECAKTIPLGGQCCGCADNCCNSGCNGCPAWDLTWSGGVRWADVGWQQSFAAADSTGFTVTDGEVGMNFRGGGLRTGLEGRRYFFKDGWLSLYAKGDISLLLGDVNVSSIRTVADPTGVSPNIVNTQTFRSRQIVPVTELEAGVTGQLSSRLSVTAGYLFAAWHDLGTRQEHQLNTLQPITYDDANILGFDGFFARAEFDF